MLPSPYGVLIFLTITSRNIQLTERTLPSPYGVLIFLTAKKDSEGISRQVAVPLRGSYLLNQLSQAASHDAEVAVPLRGSYLLNNHEKRYYNTSNCVAVPLRGSYLLNPVLYSPPFMLAPNPFCVAKPFSAHFLTQKTQKPPANPLKSSCAGKHI